MAQIILHHRQRRVIGCIQIFVGSEYLYWQVFVRVSDTRFHINFGIDICPFCNSISNISIDTSIIKRTSIGARSSPCFTPTVDSNSIVVLPFLNLILVSLYNLLKILIQLSDICGIEFYVDSQTRPTKLDQ